MLTISTMARDAVKSIPGHPGSSDQAGLRIARSPGGTPLFRVRATSGHVDCDGARFFPGPHAVRALHDRLLDVPHDDFGRLEFVRAARS